VAGLAQRLGTDQWPQLDGLDTRNAQPAIYVAGVVGAPRTGPDDEPITLAMGHSLGEVTAAVWAGAIAPGPGLDLMVERGRLGHATQDRRPGAMVAINRWERAAVEALCDDLLADHDGLLGIAVVNSPTQIVLSGDRALVALAVEEANRRGAVARLLPISGAYHSPVMADVLDAFGSRVAAAVHADPRVPVLSSTLQRPLTTAAELVDGLTRALVLPVDWPATVAAGSVTRALDAGPGDTLTRLARFIPGLEMLSP
jgi:[acyl-carrier-protein] S-malonyltransferase